MKPIDSEFLKQIKIQSDRQRGREKGTVSQIIRRQIPTPQKTSINFPMGQKIILHAHLAPGDAALSTIVVESLFAQHPGKFIADVMGIYTEEIYRHSPHIIRIPGQTFNKYNSVDKKNHLDRYFTDQGIPIIRFDHPLINRSNQTFVHFAEATCKYVGDQLGVNIIPEINRPRLYFNHQELYERLLPEPYCLINAGWKDDGETKWYSKWQEVVDQILETWPTLKIIQVGESFHNHQLLNGVIDYRGKWNGTCRPLMLAANGAEFGIGPITFLKHVFAGCHKPYVCVASGYEPPTWCWYPEVRYVTRFGTLPCCKDGGCWKRKWKDCTAMRGDKKPACMDIPAKEVISAINDFVCGGLVRVENPKITVGTYYTKEMEELGKQNEDNLRAYAKRHDYDFIVGLDKIILDRHPSWSKLPFILNYFLSNSDCEWFMWVDADATVKRLDVRIESFIDWDYDFIVGDNEPFYRFNCGVFLLRNNETVIKFLKAAIEHPDNQAWWEQGVMNKLVRENRIPGLRTKIIPRKRFNSMGMEYSNGDFIQHFSMGGKPKTIYVPGMPRPSITLGMLYTDEMRLLGKQAANELTRYAKRHGHEVVIKTESMDKERHPSWSKILLAKECLPNTEWFCVVDADMIIGQQAFMIEKFLSDDADFIVARDQYPDRWIFNTGIFFLRNCEASLKFLEMVWEYGNNDKWNHPWENGAMIALYKNVPGLRTRIVDKIASFRKDHQPNDFIWHFEGGDKPERILGLQCPLQGEEIRLEDGKPKTRECQSCGGKMSQQKVFQCLHPKGNGEIIAKDCFSCKLLKLPSIPSTPEKNKIGFSLLDGEKRDSLTRLVKQSYHLEGDLAELGVYQGGSALTMLQCCPDKLIHLYDTFQGLPDDIPGFRKKGDFAWPMEKVQELLRGYRIEFHPGLFPSTAVDGKYCCVHIDGDLYQTTIDAIDFFVPRLVEGGILVFDDWLYPECPGVEQAIKERGLQVKDSVKSQGYWIKK